MPGTLLDAAVAAVVARLDLPAADPEVDRLLPGVLAALRGADPPILQVLATEDAVRSCLARVLSGPGAATGAQRPFRVSP